MSWPNSRFIPLLVLYILFNNTLNAQVDEGSFRIGTDFFFGTQVVEDESSNAELTSNSLDWGASAGYYIIDNLELNAEFSFDNDKAEQNNRTARNNLFTIGVGGTYMIELSDDVYAPMSIGLAYNSLKEESFGDETTFNGLGFGISAGLEYIINDSIGIRFQIGPSFGNLSDNDSNAEVEFRNVKMSIGANYYF